MTALFSSSAVAQSTYAGLGAQLTASDVEANDDLGYAVAISGDTAVAVQNCGFSGWGCVDGDKVAAYVYQKPSSGWTSKTQTAILSPSVTDSLFGITVAISGDTVVVGSENRAYIFVRPASGWKNMTETAQLTDNATYFGGAVSIDGETIVVSSKASAFVFAKPDGGWATSSAHAAKLSLPGGDLIDSVAINGDTVVLGSISGGNSSNSGSAYVFEEPAGGWAGEPSPTAKLTRANAGPQDQFGISVAVFDHTIAVGTTATGENFGEGTVDLFARPPSGWTNATQGVELVSPEFSSFGPRTQFFGVTLALNAQYLVIGSEQNQFFVYPKPQAGWSSSVAPSLEFDGNTNPYSFFGSAIGVSGDNAIAGAYSDTLDGLMLAGDAYVFTLPADTIQVSSSLLEFPETAFGSNGAVLPVTVTNNGSGTWQFTASVDGPNYRVVESAENTCSAGIPAGQSCVLPIEFDPAGIGEHTNTVFLTSIPANQTPVYSKTLAGVRLRGLASGVGALSEGTLNFGPVAYGSTTILPLVVANVGVAGSPTVAVSFNNRSYSLASGGGCVTTGVSAGQTCTLMIKFAPVGSGSHNAGITLTPSSGVASIVKVTGYANSNR